MIELLAALSAAAAASIRIALPLLLRIILQGNSFAFHLPRLSGMPTIVLVVLGIWSLFELLGSKQRLIRRWLQLLQLILSPIAGAILAISVTTSGTTITTWLFGLTGATFAFGLQLVQAGWFYRWQAAPPLWFIFIQDSVCILLICLAIKAPLIGGVIALILLWSAVRSMRNLHRWFREDKDKKL